MDIGLNDKQLAYLEQIYRIRLHFLITPCLVFGGCLILILIYQIYKIPFTLEGLGLMKLGYIQASFMFFFIFPTLVLFGIFIVYYVNRLRPIERDIKLRSGEQVDFKIARKAYFPLTNEYFFFFREHEIPNIQIDHTTFLLHDLDTYFYIYRALHSKIVFENYLRFDLI